MQTGLLWFADDRADRLRHACSEADRLARWGWERHDGASFGSQRLGDGEHGVVLRTEWPAESFCRRENTFFPDRTRRCICTQLPYGPDPHSC